MIQNIQPNKAFQSLSKKGMNNFGHYFSYICKRKDENASISDSMFLPHCQATFWHVIFSQNKHIGWEKINIKLIFARGMNNFVLNCIKSIYICTFLFLSVDNTPYSTWWDECWGRCKKNNASPHHRHTGNPIQLAWPRRPKEGFCSFKNHCSYKRCLNATALLSL